MLSDLDELLDQQSGVVSRRQAVAAGLADHDLRRLLRQRQWAVVHPGVYINHTGPLTWVQQAWAAVLAVWPAALCHESALRSIDGPGRLTSDHATNESLHIAVDRNRSVAAPTGSVLHRLADFNGKAQLNTSPPRVRIEEAILDVAASAHDDFAAIAVLANAVQARRTTPQRILQALQGRRRLARRGFLVGVLKDICAGTNSALEHAFLARVERPHGLPRPLRQHQSHSQKVFRDLDYEAFDLVIELDGQLFHGHASARDADMQRDLLAKVREGRDTVRLGWGQVVRRSCATAASIGLLLQQRGWLGSIVRCTDCPTN